MYSTVKTTWLQIISYKHILKTNIFHYFLFFGDPINA